jgi:hypothetical protein
MLILAGVPSSSSSVSKRLTPHTHRCWTTSHHNNIFPWKDVFCLFPCIQKILSFAKGGKDHTSRMFVSGCYVSDYFFFNRYLTNIVLLDSFFVEQYMGMELQKNLWLILVFFFLYCCHADSFFLLLLSRMSLIIFASRSARYGLNSLSR